MLTHAERVRQGASSFQLKLNMHAERGCGDSGRNVSRDEEVFQEWKRAAAVAPEPADGLVSSSDSGV